MDGELSSSCSIHFSYTKDPFTLKFCLVQKWEISDNWC